MATMTSRAEPRRARGNDPTPVRLYSVFVLLAFVLLVAFSFSTRDSLTSAPIGTLVAWTLVAALADTLRVRLWDEFSFAMSLPVTLAAGMLLSPVEAALVAFVGAFDKKDFLGDIPLERALFNRAVAGLSIFAGSTVFHLVGIGPLDWPRVLVPSVLAYSVDFIVNVALIAFPVARLQSVSVKKVLARVVEPSPSQTVLIYASVGLLAPVIALVSQTVGLAGVLVLMLPLGLARHAYHQVLRLHEAAQRLQDKNRAIREAVLRVAEERRDERRVIAGELHDDVLQPLFQVHLMGQVLKQDLAQGKLLQLDDDLPILIAATDAAQVAIRGVVSDLRGSPIGPSGLASTLRHVADQLETAYPQVRIHLDLREVEGTDTSLLVVYQVAKEAMSNAARHANASSIDVRLLLEEGCIRLVVTDNGIGFNTRTGYLSGHFGLSLMRERVEAAGGRLAVVSALGEGTSVVTAVPPDA